MKFCQICKIQLSLIAILFVFGLSNSYALNFSGESSVSGNGEVVKNVIFLAQASTDEQPKKKKGAEEEEDEEEPDCD